MKELTLMKELKDGTIRGKRFDGHGSVDLLQVSKDGSVKKSYHSDNKDNLYKDVNNKKLGCSFTVLEPITIGNDTYKPNEVYHTDLMAYPLALYFGMASGHTVSYLNKLGVRDILGKRLG